MAGDAPEFSLSRNGSCPFDNSVSKRNVMSDDLRPEESSSEYGDPHSRGVLKSALLHP